MRNIFIFLILLFCVGCTPGAYITQKPSTTLLPPTTTELKKYYDDNIEGITCLAEILSPQRTIIGITVGTGNENFTVKQIIKNSPAELAGLKVGDIITKMNRKSPDFPFNVKSQTDFEIKRGTNIFTIKITPTLMKRNNAIETKISVAEIKGEKYIVETIITGVELNSVQFKTNYERSKWIISNWATSFWKLNFMCLQEKVKVDNIAISFQYSYKNFVTESFSKGQDEITSILSKKTDIISFTKGDISVQDILNKSMVFINGSRENLLMQ